MSEEKTPRYSHKHGLPPGALVHVGQRSEPTQLTIINYTADRAEIHELKPVEEAAPFKGTPSVTWLNVAGFRDVKALERIGQEYGIHPLVLEDVLNTSHRPKAELFDDYVFLVLKVVRFDAAAVKVEIEQVSLVLGENYVITFQEAPSDLFDPLWSRIKEGKGQIRKGGADFLAYSVADVIIDNYFLAIEVIGEVVDHLEDKVVTTPDRTVVRRLQRLKRELMVLRRSIWPIREELAALIREGHKLIRKGTIPYLHDLYDHVIRVIESVEGFHDALSGLLDIYLSSVSNRMNEIMKVLTVISTIFIPMTFITGIYGMNFRYMPELRVWWAYPAVWLLCFSIAGGMLLYFKRRRWL